MVTTSIAPLAASSQSLAALSTAALAAIIAGALTAARGNVAASAPVRASSPAEFSMIDYLKYEEADLA